MAYLQRGQLQVEVLGQGVAWLDTGTHESLMQAGEFIHTIQERQGLMVACLEEIAYKRGMITTEQLERQVSTMKNSSYANYLKGLIRNTK
jgi:glucose-1-phosphate thymidylyltransferase